MPKSGRFKRVLGSKSVEADAATLRVLLNTATTPSGATDHGTLAGLADDDHTQYGHLAQDETATGQWTIAPTSAKPPWVLGANAQDQLVTGLFADSLNKSVTAGDGLDGGGALTSNISLSVDVTDIIDTNFGLQEASNNIQINKGLGLIFSSGALELGTPGTLSVTSSNGKTSTSHTHAITSSADVGTTPVQSILASDANGDLILSALETKGDGVLVSNAGYVYLDGGDLTVGGFVNSHLIPKMVDTYDIGSSTLLWRKGWLSELDTIIFAENTITLLGGWFYVTPDAGTLYSNLNNTFSATITGTDISFQDNDPSADTITKSGGGFTTAGFKAGMVITVSGSTSNDGTYTIASLTGGVLTLGAGDALTNESAGASVTITATTVEFGKAMTEDDFVVMRQSLQVEYFQVGAQVVGSPTYEYNVTRNLDGSGKNSWPAGAPFAVLGYDTDGRIELNAYDTPRIQILEQGTAYNTTTEVYRAGDLNGNWGYSSATNGLAVGRYASSYANMTWDGTNGLRLRIYGTTYIQLSNSGNADILGKLRMPGSSSAIAIGSTPPTSSSAGTGIWIDRTGLYALSSGTYQVKIDATNGYLYGGAGNVWINSNGIFLNEDSGTEWSPTQSKTITFGGDGLRQIYSFYDGGTWRGLYLRAQQNGNSTLNLGAFSNSGTAQVYLYVNDGSGTNELRVRTDQVTTSKKFGISDYGYALGGFCVGSDNDPGTDNFRVDGDARFASGIVVGNNTASVTTGYVDLYSSAGRIRIGDGAGSYDCVLYRNAANQFRTPDGIIVDDFVTVGQTNDPGVGSIGFDGAVKPYRNSQFYTTYTFVPLTTPLTSTSFDGDSFSDVGTSTAINLTSSFGLPANVQAILVSLVARDSGAGNNWFAIGPSSTYYYAIAVRPIHGSDYEQEQTGICPTNGSSTVYYRCDASGTNTMDVWIRIWGYFI